MFISDVTSWESIVFFCTGFFDLLHETFNDSLLGDFLKARVFAGYSYTYGSLLCGALISAYVVSVVRDVIIHFIIPRL